MLLTVNLFRHLTLIEHGLYIGILCFVFSYLLLFCVPRIGAGL